MNWQPNASLATLRFTAATLAAIRQHFAESDAFEVSTPALSTAGTTDANIHSLSTECDGVDPSTRYLHTSPEFPMKRLLAAGSGDIFQICKVFRAGERGGRHNPEFTLLEWYRVGIDHHQLMHELDSLVQKLWANSPRPTPLSNFVTYADAIRKACGASLADLDIAAIRSLLSHAHIDMPTSMNNKLDDWLDLLMSEVVFPTFDQDRFTFLYNYPASQAALSRIGTNSDGLAVAERFELFFGPLELANGFHELLDSDEQRARFVQDQSERREHNLAFVPIDENLLAALESGMPACSGVAVGIERLIMTLNQHSQIDDVLAFTFDNA